MKKFIITGATGLLGRNLLFELIKQNLNNLTQLEIFILGREKNGKNIVNRIQSILVEDGEQYLGLGEKESKILTQFWKKNVVCINIDLNQEKLRLTNDDFRRLKKENIDCFFHVASLTDFRDAATIEKELRKTNVFGTKQILNLAETLKVKEFIYIGTAYACGNFSGIVEPDYIDLEQKFRNPYERTKLEAEVLVRNFSKKSKMRFRYFRPSTIAGRLIENPIGSINKFDVFYSWMAWFLRVKAKTLTKQEDIKQTPLTVNLRIHCNPKSGLNIVPADFAAKVIYQVYSQDLPDDSFYLVNNEETPHILYIPLMLEMLNIDGVRYVSDKPNNLTKLETFYYKTVGKIFTPYITSNSMIFNTNNLRGALRGANIVCPPVNRENFNKLIEYAFRMNLGLSLG